MSQYYRGRRTRESSFYVPGQHFKLSRSKIDRFLECPRCFYIDRRLGVDRPPGFPFAINSAVDTKLKTEFDRHRADGTIPAILEGSGMRPAKHPDLDEWRNNFKGVTREFEGLTISGAIDDLWLSAKGEYFVVDYKATAKKEPVVALDQDWHIGYKRQMEIYQWLLADYLPMSKTGYFLYATGRLTGEFTEYLDLADGASDDLGQVVFDQRLIQYTGDTSWVGDTIVAAKACLDHDEIPHSGKDCDYCLYRSCVSEAEAA